MLWRFLIAGSYAVRFLAEVLNSDRAHLLATRTNQAGVMRMPQAEFDRRYEAMLAEPVGDDYPEEGS